MRYKRVQNYNKLDDVEAFVVQLFNKQYDQDDIINLISINFDKQTDEAKNIFFELKSKYNVLTNESNGTKMLKVNPGIFIEIHRTEVSYIIDIVNIDHFDYMKYIDIYLKNFMMISQGIILDDSIDEFCGIAPNIDVENIYNNAQQINVMDESDDNEEEDDDFEIANLGNDVSLDDLNDDFDNEPLYGDDLDFDGSANELHEVLSPTQSISLPQENENKQTNENGDDLSLSPIKSISLPQHNNVDKQKNNDDDDLSLSPQRK